MRALRVSLILFLTLALPPALCAQWGVEFGGLYNVQTGHFVAPCGCTFANGSGYGYQAALFFDLIDLGDVAVGFKPGVEFQRFTSSSDYGAQQQVSLDYVSIGPYARLTFPVLPLFLEVMPEAQYQIGSSFLRIPSFENENPDTSLNVRPQQYALAVSVGYRLHLSIFDVAPMATVDYPLSILRSDNASDWKVTVLTASLAVFF